MRSWTFLYSAANYFIDPFKCAAARLGESTQVLNSYVVCASVWVWHLRESNRPGKLSVDNCIIFRMVKKELQHISLYRDVRLVFSADTNAHTVYSKLNLKFWAHRKRRGKYGIMNPSANTHWSAAAAAYVVCWPIIPFLHFQMLCAALSFSLTHIIKNALTYLLFQCLIFAVFFMMRVPSMLYCVVCLRIIRM